MRTLGLARGGSSFTDPSSLANLVAWYNTADGASVTASGGTATAVADKSGHGYHLNTGSGDYPGDGGGTQNGHNYLYVQRPSYMETSSFSMTTNTATMFFTGTCNWDRQVSMGAGSHDYDNTDGCLWISNDSGGTRYNGSTVFSDSAANSWHLWVVIRNGTSWEVRKDGSSLSTGSSVSTAFAATTLCVNAQATSHDGNGYTRVGDLGFYSDAKSGSALSSLESHLMTKWGL